MIKAGSWLKVHVDGLAGIQTPDDLASDTTSALQASGLNVAQNTPHPTRDIISDILAGNLLSWAYSADVTVAATWDVDNPDDVVQLVAQNYQAVTGNAPSGAFLVKANTSTPTVDATTSESGILHTLGLDGLARGLQTDAQIVIIGVLVLAGLLLYLLAFGTNVPKLATVRL